MNPIKYKITHSTKYTYSEPVSSCHNTLHLAPRDSDFQKSDYHRVVVHPVPADREKDDDYFGNQVEYFSIHQPHRHLTVTATSKIRVSASPPPDLQKSAPWKELAAQLQQSREEMWLNAAQFTTSSPRVPLRAPVACFRDESVSDEEFDAMDAIAAEIHEYTLQSFTAGRPALEAMNELNTRIHDDFTFDNKATTLNTPLAEAFKSRRGVCQDFAHIALACVRSLGLAARYVSGYLRTYPPPGQERLIGADASHAWISIFSGPQGWIDFDPTNNVIPSTDHITVGWGRDYNDVCPIRGVFVGGGRHTMTTSVDVAPVKP